MVLKIVKKLATYLSVAKNFPKSPNQVTLLQLNLQTTINNKKQKYTFTRFDLKIKKSKMNLKIKKSRCC